MSGKSSEGGPLQYRISKLCCGLLPHIGQVGQAPCCTMSSEAISFLSKEQPQKVPPLRLWAVHDLAGKESLDFCMASVYSQSSAVVRLHSAC